MTDNSISSANLLYQIAPVPVRPMYLNDEELAVILAIGENRQSGRVANYELKELVRVYRLARDMRRIASEMGPADV